MKKILLVLAICVVVYLMLLPGQKPTPLRITAGVYAGSHFNGERPYEYILEIKSPIDLSIYQYYIDYDDVIVGKETEYTFSGKNYNNLFCRFYVYPESSLLFWNNIKYFDDGLDHARIRMESVKTIVLNCTASAEFGGYTEEVAQFSPDALILNPILFSVPEDEEKFDLIRKVMKEFKEKGHVIN